MTQEVEQAGELEALMALDEARAALKAVRQNTTETLMKELRNQYQRSNEAILDSQSESNENTVESAQLQDDKNPEERDKNQSNTESLTTNSEDELVALSRVVEANLSSEHHEKTLSVLSMAERRVTTGQASTTVDLNSPSSPSKNESETSSAQTTGQHHKRWHIVKKFFTKMKSNKSN